ncbi:MAG: transmembrane 220 family protein [Myxococcota bacterium]|nr:transmembrane 220 family protein [Myxococcota bacterium]
MLRVFALANGLAGVLMGACALLQWNDPDPLQWMLFYAGGSGACLLASLRPRVWGLAAGVLAVAAAWALSLLPGADGVAPADLTASMQAKDGAVEVARELGGQLLVGAWMVVLLVRRFRPARQGQSSSIL